MKIHFLPYTVKEWLLCLACLGYRLIRGPANKPGAPKRIVVVQMAKLGDMICTTPLFRAIKREKPGIFLAVVGSRINKEVLEGNPDVDEYVVFSGVVGTIRMLRREHFDTAILAGPDMVSAAALYLAGVPFVIVPKIIGGYCPLESASYRFLRRISGMKVLSHRMGRYAPREYLRLLVPLGIETDDTIKYAYASVEAKEKARALFASVRKTGKKIVGISPGAGNKVKEWPADRFAALADKLAREDGVAVVLFGGARDRTEIETMRARISGETSVMDLSEALSLDELKAAIAELDLLVSVDTGPVYIAEALGVATVDITGPIDEHEQPPVGPRHIVVTPPVRQTPQLFVMNAKRYDYAEARRQAESITVEMVLAACRKLLASRNP